MYFSLFFIFKFLEILKNCNLMFKFAIRCHGHNLAWSSRIVVNSRTRCWSIVERIWARGWSIEWRRSNWTWFKCNYWTIFTRTVSSTGMSLLQMVYMDLNVFVFHARLLSKECFTVKVKMWDWLVLLMIKMTFSWYAAFPYVYISVFLVYKFCSVRLDYCCPYLLNFINCVYTFKLYI